MSVPVSVPLVAPTPLAAFRARAREAPERIALVDFDGTRWTRARLLGETSAVMAGLQARGFAVGHRVIFAVRPGARLLVLALAVHELGGVLVPQDPGVGDALFRARIKDVAPRWVFAEGILLARPGSLASRLLGWFGLRWAPLGEIPDATYIRVGRGIPGGAAATSYDVLRRAEAGTERSANLRQPPDDAEAVLVPTSGTTQEPRVVIHTRRSLAAILTAVSRQLALTERDVLYARDLHLLLPALAAGATAVVPPGSRFAPARVASLMAHWKVTHAFLVTRECRLLLEYAEQRATTLPTSLRMLMIGAAPVRAGFLARLRPVLPGGCEALCVYGLTEALPIARVSLEEKVAWRGDGDLVGAPIPGVHVRIRDDGQLVVSGERVCSGYLGQPAAEEIATGDIARLDEGRIVLLGRAKDMIIRGEHNIYPELYEPAIERIPGVRRAALIGDFDPVRADERVILVVEREQGIAEATLRKRVMDALATGAHRIDASATPDEVIFRTLPESGRSGKVDKAALRVALGARSAIQ